MTNEIKFRNRDEILTLWIEKTTDDGYFIGWCPELREHHDRRHPQRGDRQPWK